MEDDKAFDELAELRKVQAETTALALKLSTRMIDAEVALARVKALAHQWIDDTGLVYGEDYGQQVLDALKG